MTTVGSSTRSERIAALGGLHAFMRWPHAILTDSGGFQVMSLATLRKLDAKGVTFRSHIDGALVELSPERAIEIQSLLGSDIAMQLDECLKLPAPRAEIERAMRLSLAWGERSRRAFEGAATGRALFGIVQGGDDRELRVASARALIDIGFNGQGSPIPSSPAGGGGVTAVPEPTGMTLLALAAATLSRRRRRA